MGSQENLFGVSMDLIGTPECGSRVVSVWGAGSLNNSALYRGLFHKASVLYIPCIGT